MTSNLPESTRKTLLANLEQSASNEQLANTIRALFQNIDLQDGNVVNGAFAKYREIMTPAYRANGIENTMHHDSLSHVLEQDINRFSVQIVNANAVLKGIGSSVDICV